MDNIKKIIQELWNKNSQWQDYLAGDNLYIKLRNDVFLDETKDLINNLTVLIRNKQLEILESGESEDVFWNELQEMNILGETIDVIKKNNKIWIERYINLRPLSQMEDKVVLFMIDVFENISSNYNPQFLNNCNQYNISNDKEFINAVLQLDQIISMHIERHYPKKAAITEFLEISGTKEKYGLIYGELYEKYYLKIQNNLFMDKINELNQKVEIILKMIKPKK